MDNGYPVHNQVTRDRPAHPPLLCSSLRCTCTQSRHNLIWYSLGNGNVWEVNLELIPEAWTGTRVRLQRARLSGAGARAAWRGTDAGLHCILQRSFLLTGGIERTQEKGQESRGGTCIMQEKLRPLLLWSRMEKMVQVHTQQTATSKGAEGTENNPPDSGSGTQVLEKPLRHSQACQTRP